MSFQLSNLAKAEKSIDVRENDKDVQEIDINMGEVLRQIDLRNRLCACTHFAPPIFITFESRRSREVETFVKHSTRLYPHACAF